MSKKKINATDVAKLAGVSQSSVSRVFGSGANVAEKKRETIIQAAAQLGYQPNAIARGLITNKSKIVGIIMRNMQNPFYPEVLERFYAHLSNRGYYVLFINSENDHIQEQDIKQLLEYNVEGVIITDALLTSSAAEQFFRNDIRVILFNRYIKSFNYSSVYCDNYLGGYRIGTYFIDKGHKNLAFISGSFDTSTTVDRKKGFEDALIKRGISGFFIENGQYTYEGGFKSANRLLNLHPDIDGIFCGNDVSAFGAIDAARVLGLRIPEDVSVIGFDDIKMAGWTSYSLTTWKQPVEVMVESAVELLIEEINSEDITPTLKSIKGELIERSTVLDRLK